MTASGRAQASRSISSSAANSAPTSTSSTQGLTPVSPEDWWSRHPARPELALRLWMRSAALGVSPGGPTTLLVRRVGVRRAAAIAMEEGELLALRLPTQALRLLSLSLTWYEDAHDVLGAWQLTILLALTRVRAGVPRDSIDLTALRAAHEALVGHDADRAASGLPPWSWIESDPAVAAGRCAGSHRMGAVAASRDRPAPLDYGRRAPRSPVQRHGPVAGGTARVAVGRIGG